ncbi:MAG: hypothetical protein M3Q49_21500 [Actinomycetota bacterium]|nr:hypothetical protein [Actinomycetota bacterium]MDP9488325.1 hypothetical protein [Actinomycetota bacterium]
MPDPGELAAARDARSQIDEALLGMEDDRLRLVLVLRYGLDGCEPKTLQEAAEELGTTRECARRLQRKAHDILRRDSSHLARLLEDAS